ncbi:hypothetical protein K7432_000891 [Basidiobolus ranarum]|uniref:Uncharacterized protein n=1 Tax=Basidiobolus ranarum TaxID=34480 RepID=A0ABR2WAG2_9FUNG
MSFNIRLTQTLRNKATKYPTALIYRMSSNTATTATQKLAQAQEEYERIAGKLAKEIGTHATGEVVERLEIDLAIARQKVKRFQLLSEKENPQPKEEKHGAMNARNFLVASLSGEISPEMVKNIHDKIPDAKITPTYGNLKDIAQGLSQELKKKP